MGIEVKKVNIKAVKVAMEDGFEEQSIEDKELTSKHRFLIENVSLFAFLSNEKEKKKCQIDVNLRCESG